MSESTIAVEPVSQMLPGAFFESHREEIARAMMRVLDSGWYILGEEVRQFEEEFAGYVGASTGVGVGNGTDAIAIALRALGLGAGDRVATVSNTAVATVAAIEMAGATPVFVDIDAETYTLDPESLSRTFERFAHLQSGRIRAVIAVHLYGQPADVPAIAAIARAHGACVLEDCSQAHGARLDGRSVGAMGDLGTFSFYPTKNLGALGDGGMVVGNSSEYTQKARSLREYGWQRRYISEVAGVNSRLDELQAAILRARLKYLDRGNERRREIASAYEDGLARTGLVLPRTLAGATHVYHQYVVRHSGRERLRERLKECGVGTNVHYPVPVHRQPAYALRCEMDPAGLAVTEGVAPEILSLPMYPELSDRAVHRVIDVLHDCV